jgi:hypothetical protein
MGGALFNMGADSTDPGSGQATLVNCTLTNNTAEGGSSNGVSASIGNGGSGLGGAVFNLDGTATLTNDTLAANTVTRGTGAVSGGADGGAVFNLAFGNDIDTGKPVAASLLLNNSLLATSSTGNDLVSKAVNGVGHNAATVSGSDNLVMTSSGTIDASVISSMANPTLGPLQNNGGLTPTMLPSPSSPVLRAGDPSLAPATDQRGQPRPPNGPTDLGSVQVSIATTTGGGSSSSGATSPTSAGFFGLVLEGFALTLDALLAFDDAVIGVQNDSLDAIIDQLQTAIDGDALFNTLGGQMAVLLGEADAMNTLGGR